MRVVVGVVLILVVAPLGAQAPVSPSTSSEPPWQAFLAAGGQDKDQAEAAMDEIAGGWRDGYAPMIVDMIRFLPLPRRLQAPDGPSSDSFNADADGTGGGGGQPNRDMEIPGAPRQPTGADARRRLTRFLEKHTGQRFGDDLRKWRKWMWALPPEPHADYAAFKAEIYARIDPTFRAFFPKGVATDIRLDEIDWGGVPVNGIPPLRLPRTIPAAEATWLRDNHIIFGVVVNGEARAYPKRILAWHEMAIDRLGGVDLTVVYCTLCGTVIPYESTVAGRTLSFGTSGLLYRSNKLMFDQETGSLWSSLEGVPVVGPLVGSGAQLTFHSAVTTTWADWKREHPGTTVLSLETGFDRDYSEGAAYRDYFGTDRIMFEVPVADTRLKNKAEVLVLRPDVLGAGAKPVAIAVDRLKRQPVFAFTSAGRSFLVETTKGGANRVFEQSPSGERLRSVPAHRAFWFGWVAQHPDTELHR